MKIKNLRKRKLTESNGINFSALIRKAIRRHMLSESLEEDDTEGLDEFDDETEDFEDEDINVDGDLADGADGDDEMIEIRISKKLAEELGLAVDEAIDEEDIDISDEDVAEADLNIEAEDAADEVLGEEDEEVDEEEEETEVDVNVKVDDEELEDCEYVEEDEEAFVATKTTAPTRQKLTQTYKNQPTVDSIINGAISKYGDAKTISDGSPKRTPLTGTFKNEPTVKSRYQTGTRWLQNTK